MAMGNNRQNMAMGGVELPDVMSWDKWDGPNHDTENLPPAWDGLQNTSTTGWEGVAFAPATATAKSHGCSPAVIGQDADLDAALVDAPNHDTEILPPPPGCPFLIQKLMPLP